MKSRFSTKTKNKDILLSAAIQELYSKKIKLLQPKKKRKIKMPSIVENPKQLQNLIYDRKKHKKNQKNKNTQLIDYNAFEHKENLTLAEKMNLIPQRDKPLNKAQWGR